MTIWPAIPLERLPQLWAPDAKVLRDLEIATVGDLIRTVYDKGLSSLSDSSGIPQDPLREYVTAAEALVARQKTLRSATTISGLAVAAVVGLSATMLAVQADLPPAPAEAAYADLYRTYSEAPAQAADVLPEVNELLERFEGEPAASTVNLRLLGCAIQDSIALEELQSVADDPSGADFAGRYQRYTESFQSPCDTQDSIEADDPRIALARANAARAWTDQAATLNAILTEVSADDATRIQDDIRRAQDQARLEAALAGLTPGLPAELLTQSIEIELDNLRQQLADLIDQQSKILAAVDDEHEETRELIRELTTTGEVVIDPVQGEVCGFIEPEAATTRVQDRCTLERFNDPVSFVVTVTNAPGDGVRIDAQGPSNHSLSCDVEEVLSEIRYQDGIHKCLLTFKPK